ncbi:hypothetical protein BDW72DRAFT_180076 [Aspergillus terricola var. indicus]
MAEGSSRWRRWPASSLLVRACYSASLTAKQCIPLWCENCPNPHEWFGSRSCTRSGSPTNSRNDSLWLTCITCNADDIEYNVRGRSKRFDFSKTRACNAGRTISMDPQIPPSPPSLNLLALHSL